MDPYMVENWGKKCYVKAVELVAGRNSMAAATTRARILAPTPGCLSSTA